MGNIEILMQYVGVPSYIMISNNNGNNNFSKNINNSNILWIRSFLHLKYLENFYVCSISVHIYICLKSLVFKSISEKHLHLSLYTFPP